MPDHIEKLYSGQLRVRIYATSQEEAETLFVEAFPPPENLDPRVELIESDVEAA